MKITIITISCIFSLSENSVFVEFEGKFFTPQPGSSEAHK